MTLSFKKRQLLSMALHNLESGDPRGVHVVEFGDKNTARALERAELVTIERTTTLCAGLREWYVKITPAGIAAYNAATPSHRKAS